MVRKQKGINWLFCIIGLTLALVLILALAFFYKKNKTTIENSKKMIELKVTPELFSNTRAATAVFEPADITHYTEQPRFLMDTVIINLEEQTVQTPNFEDTQNVHCSMVQKGIKKIFRDSVDVIPRESYNHLISEILKECKDNQTVKKVLDAMKNRNANITNLDNQKEMDILNSVWATAKDNQNIKNFLITQLKDSYEKNSVVCPSGTSARIISSLTVENPEMFPRTKEMYNQEMLQTASNLRTTMEGNVLYTNLSEKEQEIQFKTELIKKLNSDYNEILTPLEIDDITTPWIDSI